MQTKNYLKELLQKYIRGKIDPSEQQELYKLLEKGDQEGDWKAVLQELSEMHGQELPYDEADWEPIIQSILNNTTTGKKTLAPVRKLYPWRRIAAAAVVLIFSVTGYFILKPKWEGTPIAFNETRQKDIAAPSNNKATITLADGSTIALDSAANGTLAIQGNVKVVKNADGEIVYRSAGPISVQHNTLFNPRGSKAIMLTLSDGTQVWLNAESSIKYPTAFTGNERTVEITGEAYFVVVHKSLQPFKVKVGNQIIEDIGTSFNIMAYNNEKVIKTTLVEGKVQLSTINNPKPVILHQGEQAITKFSGELIAVDDNADLALAIAWKNGLQTFKQADIATIMRQVERWYNVDVVYETEIPSNTTFTGEGISRAVNLSELLKVFEKGQLHFIIDGEHKKVTIVK